MGVISLSSITQVKANSTQDSYIQQALKNVKKYTIGSPANIQNLTNELRQNPQKLASLAKTGRYVCTMLAKPYGGKLYYNWLVESVNISSGILDDAPDNEAEYDRATTGLFMEMLAARTAPSNKGFCPKYSTIAAEEGRRFFTGFMAAILSGSVNANLKGFKNFPFWGK